jgi:membrane associated rhomboid family serine protease
MPLGSHRGSAGSKGRWLPCSPLSRGEGGRCVIIPISDEDRRRTFPIVNLALIAANILVYMYVYYLVDPATQAYILDNYVAIPREILQGQDVPPPGPHPLWVTIFTSMFMHANFLHIAGNMLFLFIFGDNVEDAFGHLQYLLFYLLSGVVATLVQAGVAEAFEGASGMVAGELGASGAIAGVLGAYLVLFPHARLRVLIGFGLLFFTRLSASIVIVVWFLLQFIPGLTSIYNVGGVAYFAHVGGFATGVLIAYLFLLRRRLSTPVPPPGPPWAGRG